MSRYLKVLLISGIVGGLGGTVAVMLMEEFISVEVWFVLSPFAALVQFVLFPNSGWLLLPVHYGTYFLGSIPIVIWVERLSSAFPLNTCDFCGYSLIGNTTGTCPECGTPIEETP